MTYTSLDKIVKNVLLLRGYPMHYYLPFLVSARNIMQTLIYDDGLLPPNTVLIHSDVNGEAKLPDDFIDDIQVGIRVGQYVRPLVRKDELNSLPNRNSAGDIVPYPSIGDEKFAWNYLNNFYFSTSYFNEYGEFLGRLNTGAGVEHDVYKIIPERGIIQLHHSWANKSIVLTYVGSGQGGCNCVTMAIDPMAKEVIEAYIIFDRVRHTRGSTIAERQITEQDYIKQRKIYRARKNKLGVEEIKRIFQRAYFSAPHT